MGEQIRNAMVLGAIYALVAIGYTMVYGIIELINFAHGDVFTLSGFYAIIFADKLRLDSLATSSFGGPDPRAADPLPALDDRRRPHRHGHRARRLPPPARRAPTGAPDHRHRRLLRHRGGDAGQVRPRQHRHDNANWITGQAFQIGGVSVGTKDIFVVGMALALMFGLGAFVRGTRLGKAMRATAQDRSAALLCGININRTISVTFFIGSALAAAAAIIYSINYGDVKWNLGFRLGIIAFTAAVLGGIGNIVGAGVGGFLIGIIYVFGGSAGGRRME